MVYESQGHTRTWVVPLPSWWINSIWRYYFLPTRISLLKGRRSLEEAVLPISLRWSKLIIGEREFVSRSRTTHSTNTLFHLLGNYEKLPPSQEDLGHSLNMRFLRTHHFANYTTLCSSSLSSPYPVLYQGVCLSEWGYARNEKTSCKTTAKSHDSHSSVFSCVILASKYYLWPVLAGLGRARGAEGDSSYKQQYVLEVWLS